MKLAEALILRADCQKRVEQLKQRLIRSAKAQEGEAPPEDPKLLIDELERTLSTLVDLIKRINRTNSITEFQEGIFLSDILAAREILLMKRGAYSDLANSASVVQDRYTRSEVKFISTVSVSEMQNRVDEISKQYREIDSRIQEANWRVDLAD